MEVLKLKIDKYKVFKGFEADFSNEDGTTKKIIVLAGVNGSGKTSLLEFIHKMVVDPKIDRKGYVDILTEFGSEKDNRKLIESVASLRLNYRLFKNITAFEKKQKNVDSDDNLVYLTANGTTEIIFKDKEEIFVEAISKLKSSVVFLNTEQFDFKNVNNLIFSFVKKLIFNKNVSPKDAYNEVQNILDSLFEDFDLRVRFGSIDASWEAGKESFLVYFKNRHSDKIPISDLSTGEKELITRAFFLEVVTPYNSVVLVDEPERSLHPKWQQQIFDVYARVSEKYDAQFIIATHSPHIISSVDPNSLFILNLEESVDEPNNLSISIENMETLNKHTKGVEPNRILKEIMGVSRLRYGEIDKKVNDLVSLLNIHDYDSDDVAKRRDELIRILGDKDPTMIRVNHQIKVLERKLN
ncbi:MAG: AAA family ATPase [Phaeodactylibacter xiamenensis]|uniref:AAA+ ATPase domain-containing protein n=1 Tax=Phaeodactylibacter xiamenensis TaxID=1524460 RepID=A0A098S3L2_9BACT|nr:AAA family ATPase [Phaeodactylibacter xiamenensis]KGE86383.1 hypothetical protein IX84_21550 [Phaeodactylibacter xiamenensis]MCR9050897.1 AAA family ATPase [bacterium]